MILTVFALQQTTLLKCPMFSARCQPSAAVHMSLVPEIHNLLLDNDIHKSPHIS